MLLLFGNRSKLKNTSRNVKFQCVSSDSMCTTHTNFCLKFVAVAVAAASKQTQ